MDKNFSVMSMLDSYAADNEMDPKEVFMNHPVSGNVKAEEETKAAAAISEEQKTVQQQPQKKKEWVPDAALTDGMPELRSPGAVYEKDEIRTEMNSGPLKNIMDDVALKESIEAMDDMSRKEANIEIAKKRHGFTKLQIPPGEVQTRILIAASDPDFKAAQSKLDELFDEVEKTYPEFILERADNSGTEGSVQDNIGKVKSFPESSTASNNNTENIVPMPEKKEEAVISQKSDSEEEKDAKVIIDKSALPTVAWTEEEIAKIKKSRTIELNIVEGSNIKFGEIEDVSDNAVDKVLQQYHRKTNDIVAVLPASKYRATFTGLSYPEVLDLSTSQEINSIDGERKKWSICFDHIKNPSIGPWEEYFLYKDPTTGKEIKTGTYDSIPDGVESHYVTKFEDFLRKTSFMDLEFMLWKILCATAKDKEIISIDCHAINEAGNQCNHTYDWIYSPMDLLIMDSINSAVLEEMKETAEASSAEDIMKIYKSSPVNTMDTVELAGSGFTLVIGHISAYEYLNSIYSVIKSLEDSEQNDPTVVSRGMAYATLTVIKAILLPKEGGGYSRVRGANGIVKVLNTMDEYDWQTISEITKMAIEPYQFKYALRDIICPKCKNRSTIPVEDMSRMLFIVAQSLSSVQVTLKKA